MSQTKSPSIPTIKKYKAFIGCTKEAENFALAVQANLESWCYPEIWSQGFFKLSETTIESLEKGLPSFEIAIFLLTPDDISIVRGKRYKTARDNLILEIGMAIGFLGRSRTFLVLPKNSGIKLPTDILGVTYATYDSEAPNLQAAFGPTCSQIRRVVEQHFSQSIDLLSAPSINLEYHIHPHHFGDSAALIKRVSEMVFSRRVIRRNWEIDLAYDFSKIDQNIITERITWDYEFFNITTEPIDHPMMFFMLVGDKNKLISFTQMDHKGNRVPVFESRNSKEEQQGLFLKHQRVVTLEPGISYFIAMQFLLDHPVSPEAHYIHNSFAPIEPTLNARIKATIPRGYRMDVLGVEGIIPSKFHDRWDFVIPGPLLPEQIIEYIFQKKDYADDK